MRRAILLVLVGIVSVQVGAAVAKDLFSQISPTSLVWLRLLTSGLVLVVVVRPRLRGRTARDWGPVLGFGLTLAVMNWAIYQSFARIPLGVAVTIEFLGPLTLAVVGSRRARDLVWVGLAGLGVALLGLSPRGVTLTGVLFALVAAVAWATYILLSAETGRRWAGLDGLATASVVAAIALTPFALVAGSGLLDGRIILLGSLVGVLSSVVPYSCELTALRTLPTATFGILMSLEPAAAALAAAVVLHELLTPGQLLAVACVVVASIGATRASTRTPVPVRD